MMVRAKRLLALMICLLGVGIVDASTFRSRQTIYSEPTGAQGTYMLVGNIGGTNGRLALVELFQSSFQTIFLLHVDSQDVTSFVDLINYTCEYIATHYNISVSHGSFACAGPVSQYRDYCKITNLSWAIDTHELVLRTPLKSAVLLNDFEAIGYGVEGLTADDMFCVNQGEIRFGDGTKAVIGAGTGLGKCILVWNSHEKHHIVAATEGGHADLPVYDQYELALLNFMKQNLGISNIEWEDVLSGRGLKILYRFLQEKEQCYSPYYSEIFESGYDPAVIAKYKNIDPCCQKTFELFTKFYGRCAKDFVCNALPLHGLYIAGGIAQRNLDMFDSGVFLEEFLSNRTFGSLLASVPVYVIINPNVELYGAAFFGRRFVGL